jgi:DNA topoisomerase-1
VGYQLSPLLWKKFVRGLSAGRVQSVAVKLIVEKELEIRSFQTEEYWRILANLSPDSNKKQIFSAEIKQKNKKKLKISNKEKADEILKQIQDVPFIVENVTQKQKTEKANPPLTTSLLQQQASIQLGFSTKHTMAVAQQLYEGLDIGTEGPIGLITYMRTDSYHISQEALAECRDYIQNNYLPEFLPNQANKYTKSKAQAAHEAIRPTSAYRTPNSIKSHLSRDQFKLYKLIWDRFIASQMTPAQISHTTILMSTNEYTWESKGQEILFMGYQILTPSKQETETKLPSLQEKQILHTHSITPSQHYTQPPSRYTEAGLVKLLEAKGIGRPSTYSPIISTIQERGYVTLSNKSFMATDLGIKVTEQLDAYFPKIMDTSFTSAMEDKLDQVESSTLSWVDLVQEFYTPFSKNLLVAEKEMDDIKKNPEISPYKCPLCDEAMVYKYNKKGKFLGCSQYPKCKSTLSIDKNNKPIYPEATEYKCPQCKNPMILKTSKMGRFLGCSDYPQCKTTLPIGLDGKPIYPKETDEVCPICGSSMQEKKGPYGFFLGCTQYPKCPGIKSLINNGNNNLEKLVQETCEKCGKPMILKTSKRGLFLGCTGYPDCKNLKKFTKLTFPENFPFPICPKCQSTMVFKHSYKGMFWACSKYPDCQQTLPCSLQDLMNFPIE